jgi:hypothetical protein
LCTQVQGFEKVCLSRAVRAGDKHDPGLELDLEARVRAKVPESDVADDQPASRMGMIRYQKLSSGETIRPGLSGLINLS